MRQIILDTETTGLSPEAGHRVIEIGCLEMVDRRLTGGKLHYYINPQRSIERAAVEVHGITEEFLRDKPVFADLAQDIMDYLKGAELIIHNAPFDVGFLDYEFNRVKASNPKINDVCTVIDTLSIARHKHPGQHNNLDALCRRYNVDNSNRDLHGALLDANLLAQVYLLMTGGQTQLFDTGQQDAVAVVQRKQQNSRRERQGDSLPVILPDAAEAQAHADFLQMLREGGDCLWQDDA